MLKVLFFARIRESLDCAEVNVEWQHSVSSVGALRATLAERGNRWQEVLSEENLICAVNQSVVNELHALNDGDEVAFYPPVTGG